MKTTRGQANFQIPEGLLNQLRETIGKGELSRLASGAA